MHTTASQDVPCLPATTAHLYDASKRLHVDLIEYSGRRRRQAVCALRKHRQRLRRFARAERVIEALATPRALGQPLRLCVMRQPATCACRHG